MDVVDPSRPDEVPLLVPGVAAVDAPPQGPHEDANQTPGLSGRRDSSLPLPLAGAAGDSLGPVQLAETAHTLVTDLTLPVFDLQLRLPEFNLDEELELMN